MELDINSIVVTVGKQVADFAARIDKEGITDTAELNAFSKLCNTYNRMLESAGQSRKDSPAEDSLPDLFKLTDSEFYSKMDAGELDQYPAAAIYERELMCTDPGDNGTKPKLKIPITLNIPL